jgi:hypothetical protein
MDVGYIEKNYQKMNEAAEAFIDHLSGQDLLKDIALSAQVAGLLLLRGTEVDLSNLDPGRVVLGAVPDETYRQVQDFIFSWLMSNGFNPGDIAGEDMPSGYEAYDPNAASLERSLIRLCEPLSIPAAYYPVVALVTALKLLCAGDIVGELEAGSGLALVFYHLISGSKTVPYPA